jgi:ATP synthase protein I
VPKQTKFNIKEHKRWIDSTALPMQVGLTMAGSILLCFAIGYFLDKWLNIKGLFTVIFILLGIVGGGVTVYRQIMAATEENGKRNERDRESP